MYSLLAFIITCSQLMVILASHAFQSRNILYELLIYGSPFYLAMNMLKSESALSGVNQIYLALLLFHVLKYFIIYRAQNSDQRGWLFYSAILFEAIYLALSAYYIN